MTRYIGYGIILIESEDMNMNKTGIDDGECSIEWHKQNHTEYYQATIGLKIADMLGLTQNADGRYYTTWGTKTPLGLYLCVQRILRNE